MKVSVCILFFTFMVLLNSAESAYRKLYDGHHQTYLVDENSRLPASVRGLVNGMLHNGRGYVYSVNRYNRINLHAIAAKTLRDEKGNGYPVDGQYKLYISPEGRTGLQLKDNQGNRYTVNDDGIAVRGEAAHQMPLQEVPKESDKIERNAELNGHSKQDDSSTPKQ